MIHFYSTISNPFSSPLPLFQIYTHVHSQPLFELKKNDIINIPLTRVNGGGRWEWRRGNKFLLNTMDNFT